MDMRDRYGRPQGLSMENDLPFPLLKVLSTDLYPRWYFPDFMVRASLELIPSFAALVFFFGAISRYKDLVLAKSLILDDVVCSVVSLEDGFNISTAVPGVDGSM